MEQDKNILKDELEQETQAQNADDTVLEQDATEAPRRQSRVEAANKRRKRNRFITLLCVLAVIELAACLIPFNIIDTAIPLSLALIPIVITGIILGPAMGALVGFAGGIFNMIVWSTPIAVKPAVAFVYSPFVTGGSFSSLAISLVPYVIAGTVAGVVHMGIVAAQNRKKSKHPENGTKWYAPATYAISAAVASIVSILLVLAGICMFFQSAFSADVLAGIFLLKGVVEALFVCLLAIMVCYPVLKIKEIKEIKELKDKSGDNKKDKKDKKNKKDKDDSHQNDAEEKDE